MNDETTERLVDERVRALVRLVRVGLGDVTQSQRTDAPDALAELEARLLARQGQAADAWDEGYAAGYHDWHIDTPTATNPYRAP